jgi:hypothetical protein
VLLNDAAIGVDDESGGQSGNAAIVDANFISDDGHGEIDAFGLNDLLHHVQLLIVGQADDLQAFLVAILEFDKAGDFRATWPAPGGPEIQEDDFAVRGSQRKILARQVLELKIGGRVGIARKADPGQLGGSRHGKEEAEYCEAQEAKREQPEKAAAADWWRRVHTQVTLTMGPECGRKSKVQEGGGAVADFVTRQDIVLPARPTKSPGL